MRILFVTRHYSVAILLATIFCLVPTRYAVADSYITDPAKLDQKSAREYHAIRDYINVVDNVQYEISTIKPRLDRFIKEHKNFLPIYIEKARYLVIYGYSVSGDDEGYNRQALAILKDLEHKDPGYQKTYVLETHVYTNLGQYREALAASDKAESMKGTDPWIQLNKERLLEIQGKDQEALSESIEGLRNSGSNPKATTYALETIIRLSDSTGIDVSKLHIANIVFQATPDPKQRMFIASWLVNGHSDEPRIMKVATDIILRQQKLTPELPDVRLNAARLALYHGFIKYTVEGFYKYKQASVNTAFRLLSPIENAKGYRVEVYKLEAKAALGASDIGKIHAVLRRGKAYHIPQKLIDDTNARYFLLRSAFKDSIKLFDKLAKADPSYLDDDGYCSAYANIGDYSKLENLYHRQMKRYPDNSWVFANYASYLLYRRTDYKKAMHYGEIAMNMQNTAFARKITGITYQIAAAYSLNKGKVEEAMKKYAYGVYLGVSKDDLEGACGAFCHPVRDEFTKRYGNNL